KGHDLDDVAGGVAGEAPRRAPVLGAVVHVVEAGDRRLVVVGDDRDVAARRHDRIRAEQQVDLLRAAREPDRAPPQLPRPPEPPADSQGISTGDTRSPHTSTPAAGAQIAIPSTVWPAAGCSSSSASPSSSLPGTGSSCTAPSRSGRGRVTYHSSSKARSSRCA